MSERGHHCPYLNHADLRCSTHLSLDRLQDAFEHCFDRYHLCAVHREIARERRSRRLSENASADSDFPGDNGPAVERPITRVGADRRPRRTDQATFRSWVTSNARSERRSADALAPAAPAQLVQVSLRGRHPQPASVSAVVPAPPRL